MFDMNKVALIDIISFLFFTIDQLKLMVSYKLCFVES